MCDVDGYTSSAILWLYIKDIYPDADLNFIVHDHKQHGLSDVINQIENDFEHYELVICPDSASYDVEEHQILHDMGTDCLILDHHDQAYDDNGNPIISHVQGTVVINNQLSPQYTNKSLCGAGVVYKFCELLDNMLNNNLAYKYIDLVALGEIADVMDRTNVETNYLMMEGLKHIRNKGFKTLLESQSYSLKEKGSPPFDGLNTIDIAFYIAPLINAITRVGTKVEKEVMFKCFVEPDALVQSTKRGAKSTDFETAAEQTARVSKNAKSRQDRLKEKAIDNIIFKIEKEGLNNNNIILVEVDDDDEVPQELTGLIAMAMVNKYNKPVMIGRANSDNLVQGSIRSNSNFAGLPSFKQFLESSSYVEYVAGHDNAAGFGVYGNKIDKFIRFANTNLKAEDFENCYIVDYILNAKDNIQPLLNVIGGHPEYFGNHIDEVKFVIKDVPLTNVQFMGTNKDSVKISYNGIDYVRFKDDEFAMLTTDKNNDLTVYGRVNINYFAGRYSTQIFIDDYEFNVSSSKYDF